MAKTYYEKFTEGLDCDFYQYKGKTKLARYKELLSDRDTNIGASEVGKIMNLSDYGCSTMLYREKKGLLPQKEQTWAMRRGQALEPVVIEVLKEKYPSLNILEGNKILCIHKDYNYIRCNPDALIIHEDGSREGLEIKNISPFNRNKWSDTEVPPDYYAQCQESMYVTGLNKWRLAVSFDCEPIEYFILRDDDFIEQMKTDLINFKYALDNNIEPELDEKYYNKDTFQALYPMGKSKNKVFANEQIGQNLLKIDKLESQKKIIEAELDELKSLCMFYMGEQDGNLLYETIINDDGLERKIYASARMQTTIKKPTFSTKIFKEKYPDIYSKYENECITEPTASRSFGWIKIK